MMSTIEPNNGRRYTERLSDQDRQSNSRHMTSPKNSMVDREEPTLNSAEYQLECESLETLLVDAAHNFPSLLNDVDLSDESIACVPELQMLADLKKGLHPNAAASEGELKPQGINSRGNTR